jgi:hypothetical protein
MNVYNIVIGALSSSLFAITILLLLVFIGVKWRKGFPFKFFHPYVLLFSACWMLFESLNAFLEQPNSCREHLLRGWSTLFEYASVSCILAWILSANVFVREESFLYQPLDLDNDSDSDSDSIETDSSNSNSSTIVIGSNTHLKLFHRIIFFGYILVNLLTMIVVLTIAGFSCRDSIYASKKNTILSLLNGSTLFLLYLCIVVSAFVTKCSSIQSDRKNIRVTLLFTAFGLINMGIVLSRIIVFTIPRVRDSFTFNNKITMKQQLVWIACFVLWEILPMMLHVTMVILQWGSDRLKIVH